MSRRYAAALCRLLCNIREKYIHYYRTKTPFTVQDSIQNNLLSIPPHGHAEKGRLIVRRTTFLQDQTSMGFWIIYKHIKLTLQSDLEWFGRKNDPYAINPMLLKGPVIEVVKSYFGHVSHSPYIGILIVLNNAGRFTSCTSVLIASNTE